eukprot:TRINITY_DN11958_c0_g1_i1.p1 TRINITY_DN11958_c0_g1~~TRINITY_DN11958_c0_g1_i1.p1  ORF type:complete len:932 (+),score=161.63 TRINITY_DN11958_c0_g1_i1:69-2864(+)
MWSWVPFFETNKRKNGVTEVQPLTEAERESLFRVLGASANDDPGVNFMEMCIMDKPRVLILFQFRLFLGKVSGRRVSNPIIRSELGHLHCLTQVTAVNKTMLRLKFKDATSAVEAKVPQAELLVRKIMSAFHFSFPIRFPDTVPIFQAGSLNEIEMKDPTSDCGPCGGFSHTLLFFWTFYKCQSTSNLAKNIQLICHLGSCGSRRMDVQDWHVETPEEVKAMMETLAHNSWFKDLVVRKCPLIREIVIALGNCLRYSRHLESVEMIDLSVQKELVSEVAQKISLNTESKLTKFVVSYNLIGQTGIAQLSRALTSTTNGIEHLVLSNNGLDAVSLAYIFNSFEKTRFSLRKTKHFAVDFNYIGHEASIALAYCLIHASKLEYLSLCSTSPRFDIIGPAISARASTLVKLNVSNNRLTMPDVESLSNFLQIACTLKKLNFSNCNLDQISFSPLLYSIQANTQLCDLHINFAGNPMTPSVAASIGSVIYETRRIISADLSECNLGEEGLASLFMKLTGVNTLQRLYLSGNYKYQGKMNRAIECITQYIKMCVGLRTLSLSGTPSHQWKTDIIPIVDALPHNRCLTDLDLSSNMSGDAIMFALSRGLSSNKFLKILHLDKNNISHRGFQELHRGLQYNWTLKMIPTPLSDISRILKDAEKEASSKFKSVFRDIEKLLWRNASNAIPDVSVLGDLSENQTMNLRLRALCYSHLESKDLKPYLDLVKSHGNLNNIVRESMQVAHQEFSAQATKIIRESCIKVMELYEKSVQENRVRLCSNLTESYKALGPEFLKYLSEMVESREHIIDPVSVQSSIVEGITSQLSRHHLDELELEFAEASHLATRMTLDRIQTAVSHGELLSSSPNPLYPPIRDEDSILSPEYARDRIGSIVSFGRAPPPTTSRFQANRWSVSLFNRLDYLEVESQQSMDPSTIGDR